MITFEIKKAQTAQDYHRAKELVLAYAAWLNIDLSYQQFDEELAHFEQSYGPPLGGILLLKVEDKTIGCVGIRPLEGNIAELKRMFIQAEYRGKGLGKALLTEAIKLAQSLRYHKIRLDTLPSMTSAVRLYYLLGFYKIPPYRFNPNPDTIFLEMVIEGGIDPDTIKE